MSNNETIKWKATAYLRLSKEDGDKEESCSISNQKDLIKQFVESNSDIEIYSERIDDGFSGVDFNRPAFEQMISDIKNGLVNCCIVKDLSRFSRNWIESGKYLDKIFPFLGVRFIAINDNIDSAKKRTTSDNIIIPFKNLVNDSYLRDISIKVRSQLEIKRKNGDFIGSFCVYGYKKDPVNHNKIVVDEKVAGVINDIFKWKIEGFSQQSIANKLNKLEIPSPLEYKLQNGENFKTPFKIKRNSEWTAVSVRRILTNKIYIGVLEQGKSTTPNYKVKKRVLKQADEWVTVEDNHDPIVSKHSFMLANDLLEKDVRKSPNEDSLFLFSGLLYCADCGQGMVRKTVPSRGKKYFYYVCSTNKNTKSCSSHSIKEQKLELAILKTLQSHVKSVVSIEELTEFIKNIPYKQLDAEKISKRLKSNKEEVELLNQKRLNLYEDFKEEVITKDEYSLYKKSYDEQFETLTNKITALEEELNSIVGKQNNSSDWIEYYKSYANIDTLTRKIVVNLIEKIIVHEKHGIEILFKYQYDFDRAIEYIQNSHEEVCING